MEKPEPFTGEHDDIERFLGDCQTYYEVFRRHYREHPAYKIVFATSLLKGEAKNWWVHLRPIYEYTKEDKQEDQNDDPDDPEFHGGPHYRFPSWETFCALFREQFRNPAIEFVHEQRLLSLKMMGPAYLFFQEIKKEAKLARWDNDYSE